MRRQSGGGEAPRRANDALILFSLLLVLAEGCAVAPLISESAPLNTFGVIADIQYADREDIGAVQFRASLKRLPLCIEALKKEQPDFLIQMGDMIGGSPSDPPKNHLACLRAVNSRLDGYPGRRWNVIGNHDRVLSGRVLRREFRMRSFYYALEYPGWLLIILDTTEAGAGVLSKRQIAWLRRELARARGTGRRVLVFGHHPLIVEATCSFWAADPQPVIDAMLEAGCVVAYFAGHSHRGGYEEKDGIHHFSFEGLVESATDVSCAIVEIHEDRLEVRGLGSHGSRTLRLDGKNPENPDR
ncbi:MAG: metallophosphoesterase [Planctomycetota bacterium]